MLGAAGISAAFAVALIGVDLTGAGQAGWIRPVWMLFGAATLFFLAVAWFLSSGRDREATNQSAGKVEGGQIQVGEVGGNFSVDNSRQTSVLGRPSAEEIAPGAQLTSEVGVKEMPNGDFRIVCTVRAWNDDPNRIAKISFEVFGQAFDGSLDPRTKVDSSSELEEEIVLDSGERIEGQLAFLVPAKWAGFTFGLGLFNFGRRVPSFGHPVTFPGDPRVPKSS